MILKNETYILNYNMDDIMMSEEEIKMMEEFYTSFY